MTTFSNFEFPFNCRCNESVVCHQGLWAMAYCAFDNVEMSDTLRLEVLGAMVILNQVERV